MHAFQFSFTSRHADLLDAYDADRSARTGLSTWSRGLLMLLGVMWLLGFLLLGPKTVRDAPILPLVWLGLGVLIFWRVGFKPYLEKRRIKESNEPEQEVTLSFSDRDISSIAPDGRRCERRWDEIVAVESCKLGVLVAFEDGMRNWIPNRAFAGATQRNAFVAFLVEKMRALEAKVRTARGSSAP